MGFISGFKGLKEHGNKELRGRRWNIVASCRKHNVWTQKKKWSNKRGI